MYVCLFVCVQVKKGGGMSINSTLTLTKMSEKLVQLILHEYSILQKGGGGGGEGEGEGESMLSQFS